MSFPSQADNPNGLHNRFTLTRTDGKPIDPEAEYFVLRLDDKGRDAKHVAACRLALLTYAEEIAPIYPNLAEDIKARYAGKVSNSEPAEFVGNQIVINISDQEVQNIAGYVIKNMILGHGYDMDLPKLPMNLKRYIGQIVATKWMGVIDSIIEDSLKNQAEITEKVNNEISQKIKRQLEKLMKSN